MLRGLGRIRRILSVINRHGLGEFLDGLDLKPAARLALKVLAPSRADSSVDRGERLRRALEELGPVFVKFGQVLSTRPDLLADDVSRELIALQDQVPPFPGAEARRVVEDSFGEPIGARFAAFSDTPMASASVAQVHEATLLDGTDVVVKILRPGIVDIIDRDLELLYTMARTLEKVWKDAHRLKPVEIVRDYDRTIHDELDMQREAGNASQMRANFIDSDLIYVPEVYFDHTTRDVMVMEKIDGISIREVDQLRALGIDMKKLAHEGVEIFFTQAFRDGFFHADMHPGNILVSRDGQYRAIDFGIMGTLADADKRYLAENFLAFFNRDYRAVADAHLRAGWVPAHIRAEDFESAIRTVCEPIFAKPISEISFGKLVMRLFQTARRFEMPVQTQLVLLQKTLLQIEGLGRQLYPDLDLWDTAKPYLERWMNEQIGPRAAVNTLKKEAPRWATIIPEMPRVAHTFLSRVDGDGPDAFVSRGDLDRATSAGAARSRYQVQAIVGVGLIIAASVLAAAPGALSVTGWIVGITGVFLSGHALYRTFRN